MSKKKQSVNIVGAGLAGLTAAINLARQGKDVTVYEKGNRIGGMSLYNPSPHGTPMDADRMSSYVGFDVTPGMEPMPVCCLSIFGKRYPIEISSGSPCWMIERGPRKTSMDNYLAGLAQEAGARIIVSSPIESKDDLDDLKAGGAKVIVATGLHIDGYEATGVPYVKLYGYFAKGRVPWPEVRTTIYFDDYSPDYAFTCSVNGIGFALIFNRHCDIERWEWQKFSRQAVQEDGYPFGKWQPFEIGGAPVEKLNNPRLFHGDLILAGTLAGMMDPILFFGMHGAFLSGKIAAMAVDDPAEAEKEFKRLNVTFKPVLAAKRALDHLPGEIFLKYPARLALDAQPLLGNLSFRHAFMANISGYNRF